MIKKNLILFMLINLNQFANSEEISCQEKYDTFIATVKKYYSDKKISLTTEKEEDIKLEFFVKCYCRNRKQNSDCEIDICQTLGPV